jgi:hypothetical protein
VQPFSGATPWIFCQFTNFEEYPVNFKLRIVMNKLLLILLLFFNASAIAQEFEGLVKWSVKMDFKDHRKKSHMEHTQKKMKDPAMQSKVQEMEAKMSNPEQREAIQKDPKMKHEMNQTMALLKSSALYPTGIIMRIREGNTITALEGTLVSNEVLDIKATGESFNVNRQHKTYSKIGGPPRLKPNENVSVTKTTETATILGYRCTKYLIENKDPKKGLIQEIWTTTDFTAFDLRSFRNQKFGRNSWYFEGVEGVPLRMVAQNDDGDVTIEAIAIEKRQQKAEDFSVPADYKEVRAL